MRVSAIIPAFNEQDWIEETVSTLRELSFIQELIVVDDGSIDCTATIARPWVDQLITLPKNVGKGVALQAGLKEATGDIILFLDADLQKSAREVDKLLTPVVREECDMTIAILPKAPRKAGFGLTRKLAYQGIAQMTQQKLQAPLSGQRAFRRDLFSCVRFMDCGFGIEVAMTIDILRAGYRIKEVPVKFTHRYTSNNLHGFLHRGKEFWHVYQTLQRKRQEVKKDE
ncbi:glycosyltransferase family 2 protein [Brevibacillus laterosporus]|nr:glycosyltransferase family 2 protein [Brevibacillus laterosporus]ATO51065.1 glycosyltransferase [Brevibacillus laterosporus DSM 25]MBG9796811.1 glycosyltransferase [Brevibacillus laterosporus]MCR8939883.1 glycosyltransferase family 2 protein [Brevibacillus laterosporus]MCZ0842523.1 glycosyltransferase family 2 protein [Brevibacillus laterosporus]MCZ0847105.1 glycosyltransferase family 2 protein [Brevibacillus laterosporus]